MSDSPGDDEDTGTDGGADPEEDDLEETEATDEDLAVDGGGLGLGR